MGIFSSGGRISVGSTVYNMAGDQADRPNYLKTLVLSSVIGNNNFSVGQTIQSGYLGGPAMRLRAFYRWAENNYDLIGIPSLFMFGTVNMNLETVKTEMIDSFGISPEMSINWVEAELADITYWARKYLGEEAPEKLDLEWKADYDAPSNTAMITFPDLTGYVFTPEGFDPLGAYMYVSYSIREVNNTFSGPFIFIYKAGGSNNILNAQYMFGASDGGYMPYIPIRADSTFLSEEFRPAYYELAKKAYKKATGSRLDELIDILKENEDIGDIDYTYLMYAASLNTKTKEGREYIYRFLKKIIDYQTVNDAALEEWREFYEGSESSSYSGQYDTYNDWDNSNQVYQDTLDPGTGLPPDGGPPPPDGPMPPRPPMPFIPRNEIKFQAPLFALYSGEFVQQIRWTSIIEEEGVGLGKPDAKLGELWWTVGDTQLTELLQYGSNETDDLRIDEATLWWQDKANAYRKLIVKGMVHKNSVYQGKFVEINLKDALLDEEESGFLVPLHTGTLNDMTMVKQTQLVMTSGYLVFNSYEVVKRRWYQTGLFKFFLVIAVIAITVQTGGFGAGSAGLLGTNAAVGTALGFAGAAAVIAGVVANMVAAMIVTRLIMYASVEIFGEKLGLIIAAIASFIALNVGSALRAGQSMATAWSNLMSPMNLLNLTNSLGKGYADMVNADTMGIIQQSQDLAKDYAEQSRDLTERYAENIGYDRAMFDPTILTETGGFTLENRDSFLGRTLLTGSEIAEMSVDMISKFADLTLTLDLPS